MLEGKADVTSIFAPTAKAGVPAVTGLAQVWPDKENQFRVLGFTEEAPNDGVAVSMGTASATVTELEKTLLSMHLTPAGAAVLKDCFHADKFELAPRMGYRTLYHITLTSL